MRDPVSEEASSAVATVTPNLASWEPCSPGSEPHLGTGGAPVWGSRARGGSDSTWKRCSSSPTSRWLEQVTWLHLSQGCWETGVCQPTRLWGFPTLFPSP